VWNQIQKVVAEAQSKAELYKVIREKSSLLDKNRPFMVGNIEFFSMNPLTEYQKKIIAKGIQDIIRKLNASEED
jgi:hypothetical protein